MKKLVILLLAVISSVAVFADERPKVYDKVLLTLVDGRVFDIEIDADSYIYSYVKGKGAAVIQYVEVAGKSEVYLFERNDLRSVRFVEALGTDIKNVPFVDECNPMRYIDGELVFHSSLNGEKFEVYDAAGKLVKSGVVNSEQRAPLDILAMGTYLVKVNECKIKVLVR